MAFPSGATLMSHSEVEQAVLGRAIASLICLATCFHEACRSWRFLPYIKTGRKLLNGGLAEMDMRAHP